LSSVRHTSTTAWLLLAERICHGRTWPQKSGYDACPNTGSAVAGVKYAPL
jgi:hypothetical protein